MQTYANQPTYSFIDWHKLFLGKKKFPHGFRFFFFYIFGFVLILVSTGAFAPATQFPGRGKWLSCVEHTRLVSGAPPQWSLPFWGPLALATKFLPEEKRRSPERVARKPTRVKQVVPLQVDRKHPSGVLAVLFLFFREDIHQFTLSVQAVSPCQRKTPRPKRS